MNTTRNTIGLGIAAAALALGLAGCAPGADGTAATEEATGAAAFVACLTAAGVDAKVGDEGHVLVKQGDAGVLDGGTMTQSSSETGEDALLMVGDADGSTWVAAASSAYFVDDPDTQDAYAGCESEHPDFTQPESDPLDDPQLQEELARQAEDGLTFARCARDAGFSWVADPVAEDGASPSIDLPADLTEDEFRALLEACYAPELNLAWAPSADLSFDWTAVMDEVTGGVADSSSSISVGGDE